MTLSEGWTGAGRPDRTESGGLYRGPTRDGERERRLFDRYRRSRDPAAREALVARYLPLARSLAHRYGPMGDSPEDLFQVASLALLKAIDRFEPERHASFSSYAVPTILGELKRHFRDQGWALHVPRDLQELALRVMRETEEASRRLGRSPTPGELADVLGISVEQVLEAQDAATAYRAEPLEDERRDDEEAQPAAGQGLGEDDPGYGLAEQRATLDPLMARLAEREREVLALRFQQDLTQSEIGERLGISQMQVSRIIRQAIQRLQRAAGTD